MNKFLVAFDKCKDSLSAPEICDLAERVLIKRFPETRVTKVPLTDGGEGFVQILSAEVEASIESVKVMNSIGKETTVKFGLCKIEKLHSSIIKELHLPTSGNLAILEMAECVGLADLPNELRNPWETSTFGVGQLLRKTADLGVDAILLGIGGSSTNDIGLGALVALGATVKNKNNEKVPFPYPLNWSDVSEIDFDDLVELPPITIACDVENKLLGESGATAVYGPQKGLAVEDIGKFEDEIKRILTLINSKISKVFEKSNAIGSGAAGGMGYGLSLFYNVSMINGFDLISSWFSIDELMKNADFVITGEGRFDKTSLNGKGPFEVIRQSSQSDIPSLVLAGSVDNEVKRHVKGKFNNCDLLAFGRSDWTLEKNLLLARDQFTSSLQNYPFP